MIRPRRLLVTAASITVWACSSTPDNWSNVGGTAATEAQIYETTVRYIAQHYDPFDGAPAPVALCLAVGRRSAQALGQARRGEGEPWVASGRLIARMADLDPPVVPVSQCEWNAAVEETHVPSGRAAVVVTVDRPTFSTPVRASTTVRTRQNASYAFRYRCDLDLEGFGWVVRRCL